MLTKDQMITEILICAKANEVYISGELFFRLAFMAEDNLRKICRELHIKA